MTKIPLLAERDIDCRVQSVSKSHSGKVGAILLLYKDARVDMRILDATYGVNNWQRTHEVINGNLFCTIELWDNDKNAWVKKQDVGVESKTEEEKGQASDAFKRAGFNVGIGRELYTAPFIYVELLDNEYYGQNNNGKEVYKCKASTKFTVSKIGYNDRREINELVIVDKHNVIRFTMKSDKDPKKSSKYITIEQQQELINISKEVWGADAGKYFKQLTGINDMQTIPISEFNKIKQKIMKFKEDVIPDEPDEVMLPWEDPEEGEELDNE